MKLTINQLDEADRPREKMMHLGANALSNAELLAILIGSGTKEENAVSLMQRILADCGGDLARLSRMDLAELGHYKGMGPAKSLTVLAALELGRRRALQGRSEQQAIGCSEDVYNICLPFLRDQPTEEVWVLLLSPAARLIHRSRVSQGGIDHALVDVRTILREALVHYATQIVLVHNHPSGNNRPSQADCRLTEEVQQAAKLMHIRLMDHVIVCDGIYYSFNDDGKL